jgi:hypothetical protein
MRSAAMRLAFSPAVCPPEPIGDQNQKWLVELVGDGVGTNHGRIATLGADGDMGAQLPEAVDQGR